MSTTTTVGENFEPSRLAIVVYKKARFAPTDVVYTENPMGAYRGLAFALIFNVLLALTGAAGYGLWRLLR